TRDGDTLQRVAEWCLSYDGSESTERSLGESGSDLPWRFLVPDEIIAAVEPETRTSFERVLASVPFERVSLGPLDDWYEPFRTVQAAEAWRSNGEWVTAHPDAVGPAVAERFRLAAAVTPDDEKAARERLESLRARVQRLVEDAVLILPTVPGPAPMRTARGERVDAVRQATLRMTTPAAIGGLPAVSAPLLTVPSQLGPAPVGVCLVSRAGTDIALVRLARRLAASVDPLETP
ncbi:MAG: DUF3225 domain-containing protein, partial [Microbacteriaceae bacterium]